MEKFTQISISAPSKLILHGEHSVVYGKMAVAGSLDLRTSITLNHNNAMEIEVDFPDIGINRTWSLEEIKSRLLDHRPVGLDETELNHSFISVIRQFLNEDEDSLSQASLTCFFYLLSTICSRPIPMKIKVKSEIPIGAGLGSSAALSVCLSAGLLHVTKEVESSAKVFSEVEICRLAFLSEKILHGTPSGVDNSVSTFGGVIQFVSGEVTRLKEVPLLRVILVNTNITRRTKPLVDKVRDQLVRFPEVIEPLLEAMDGVSRKSVGLLADIYRNGASSKSYDNLNSLLDYNQKLLETLKVSHSRISVILEIAQEHHLHGKLTGAGGGGFVFILVPPHVSEKTVASLLGDFEAQEFDCWDTSFGVDGVVVEKQCSS